MHIKVALPRRVYVYTYRDDGSKFINLGGHVRDAGRGRWAGPAQGGAQASPRARARPAPPAARLLEPLLTLTYAFHVRG